jgi:hypothetical protein
VNNKLVDFLQAATERHKIGPGCSAPQPTAPQPHATSPQDEEPVADPCLRKPCKHGACNKIDRQPGYECRCDEGYMGMFCDIRGELIMQMLSRLHYSARAGSYLLLLYLGITSCMK